MKNQQTKIFIISMIKKIVMHTKKIPCLCLCMKYAYMNKKTGGAGERKKGRIQKMFYIIIIQIFLYYVRM